MSEIDPKAPSDMGANARRMRAERESVKGLSTDELEAGIVVDAMAALAEAEAGLCFAGADKDIPAGAFAPSPTLALRAVRRVLARLDRPTGGLTP
jgi:hypothetical protein